MRNASNARLMRSLNRTEYRDHDTFFGRRVHKQQCWNNAQQQVPQIVRWRLLVSIFIRSKAPRRLVSICQMITGLVVACRSALAFDTHCIATY